MAAPDYVPVPLSEQPRGSLALPPSRRWAADRPGDLNRPPPAGALFGSPGPDQGYALKLAERFRDQVQVEKGEHVDDALAGASAVALRRASLFGRAPVIHDLDIAFRIWGFLGEAPDELVAFRRTLFEGAAHHYDSVRAIVDLVPDETLRCNHAEVARRFPSEWRSLLGR